VQLYLEDFVGIANPVLFHIGKSPWTLGGVCIFVGIIMILLWAGLLPFVIRKLNGKARRLDAQEAATLAMTGHETEYAKPQAAVHGPSAGLAWHFECSIGDLREAWQQGRYGFFFGVPAFGGALLLAITLIFEGGAIRASSRPLVLILLSSPAAIIVGIYAFMMWAAVYTNLE
jgi:hypothetical protein